MSKKSPIKKQEVEMRSGFKSIISYLSFVVAISVSFLCSEFFLLLLTWVSGQCTRISINLTGSKVNDHKPLVAMKFVRLGL